jgi:LacI family transcriptional regulator
MLLCTVNVHRNIAGESAFNYAPRTMRKAAAKLTDVARTAGVSLATASRALGSPELVHPETQEKVRTAADLLGYVPHGAARALASRRSRTIGTVLPTIDNPIFASATQALARALSAASYTLLVASHEYDPATEVTVTRTLLERGVDGLVLVGIDHSPELFHTIARAGVPYELTWALDPAGHHHCVGFSNREAGRQLAQHLLDLGHRRFAVLSGYTAHNDRARERLAGVRDALASQRLRVPDDSVVETAFSLSAGRAALRQLWERLGREGFTALVCGNDLLALGALLECAAERIEVPRSLSVVGFDDIELGAEFTPALTTMHVPSSDIGRLAAQRLLARLEGKREPRAWETPVNLVVRETTGPAPKAARRAAR